MLAKPSQRRMLLGLALAAAAGVALVLALGLGLLWRYYGAADYPGAVLVADHTLSKVTPVFYFRRDTAYRTADQLPAVYHWYSQTFRLGPEARAQSACITLERASTWLGLEGYTSVTLCDTPNGRLMFVQRSLLLRPPRW